MLNRRVQEKHCGVLFGGGGGGVGVEEFRIQSYLLNHHEHQNIKILVLDSNRRITAHPPHTKLYKAFSTSLFISSLGGYSILQVGRQEGEDLQVS